MEGLKDNLRRAVALLAVCHMTVVDMNDGVIQIRRPF